MFSPLDAAEFAKALNSESGLQVTPAVEGFVRKITDAIVIVFPLLRPSATLLPNNLFG